MKKRKGRSGLPVAPDLPSTPTDLLGRTFAHFRVVEPLGSNWTSRVATGNALGVRCRFLSAFAFASACTTLATGPARADAGGLDLSWEAPAECATAGAIEADIASLMDGPAVNRVRARARVRREAEALWILDLQTETSAGLRTRELRGTSCAELASAAATVLALEVGGVTVATLPEPKVARADDPTRADAPARAETLASNPTEARAPTPAPSPMQQAFAFGVEATACTGAIGALAPGAGLSAAWLPGHERVEVAAAFYPSSHVDRTDLGIGGDFDLFVAGVGACHAFVWGAFSAGPCLGAEAGRVGASGTGSAVASSSTQAGLWLAGRAGGLAVLDLGRFSLRGEVDAVVPLVRDSFAIRGIDQVYRPAAVSGRLLLGGEIHFR
jgi:hypothetical protein